MVVRREQEYGRGETDHAVFGPDTGCRAVDTVDAVVLPSPPAPLPQAGEG